MLFDLKGKRRRVVQAIYLTLALLMGGGLVFFGIGGDVSGGLFDAFSSRTGDQDGSSQFEGQLASAREQLAADPQDEAALAQVVRANYQLALDAADPQTGAFSPAALNRLEDADSAWQRYLELNPERPRESSKGLPSEKAPDVSLATLMMQAYSEPALNEPAKAADAAELIALARPSANSYLLLTRYSALAGETRKSELAGKRAVELAEDTNRDAIEEQVAQIQKAGARVATDGQQQPGERVNR